MGAPLRKPRFVANDFQRPAALPMPVANLVPYVRLPSTPPRERLSWISLFAAALLTCTIFMLGVVAGTVFWFTYDFHEPSQMPSHVSMVEARLRPPVAVSVPAAPPVEVSALVAAPADIVLPAESADMPLAPPAAYEALAAAVPIDKPTAMRNFADIDMLLGEARAQLEKGHDDIALVFYERVLLIDRENPAALEGKTLALGRLNPGVMMSSAAMPKGVLPDVKQNVPAPDDATAQIALAKSLVAKGSMEEAVIHLDRAVHMEPDNFTYRLDLAILYDRVGKEPQALTLYRQVLAMSDDSDTPLAPSWLDAIRQRADYLDARDGLQ